MWRHRRKGDEPVVFRFDKQRLTFADSKKLKFAARKDPWMGVKVVDCRDDAVAFQSFFSLPDKPIRMWREKTAFAMNRKLELPARDIKRLYSKRCKKLRLSCLHRFLECLAPRAEPVPAKPRYPPLGIHSPFMTRIWTVDAAALKQIFRIQSILQEALMDSFG
jgi:hypothetical protein